MSANNSVVAVDDDGLRQAEQLKALDDVVQSFFGNVAGTLLVFESLRISTLDLIIEIPIALIFLLYLFTPIRQVLRLLLCTSLFRI